MHSFIYRASSTGGYLYQFDRSLNVLSKVCRLFFSFGLPTLTATFFGYILQGRIFRGQIFGFKFITSILHTKRQYIICVGDDVEKGSEELHYTIKVPRSKNAYRQRIDSWLTSYTYIHTYIHHTYIHTYIHTYMSGVRRFGLDQGFTNLPSDLSLQRDFCLNGIRRHGPLSFILHVFFFFSSTRISHNHSAMGL